MSKLFSEVKELKEKEDLKEKDKEFTKDKHDKNEKNEKEKSEKDAKDKEQKDSKDKEQKDQKDQKEQKDTKEGKDTKDQKDKENKHEKQEKEKHEKELKDRKEDLKERAKEKEDLLEVRPQQAAAPSSPAATPSFKFIEKFVEKFKDFKGEKIEIKEFDKAFKDKDKDVFEGFGGFGTGGDPALTQRVAALEATVAHLMHFIPPNLRPDLSTGALSQEPDEGKAPGKAPAEPAHKTEPPADKGKK